jgi:hypothetical protein
MTSPTMPFMPKIIIKKNAVAPLSEDQLQQIRNNLPALELVHHKTSCEMPETLNSASNNLTQNSARGRSVTFDALKSKKGTSKSPTKSRHKFSVENYEGRVDSFGYPILKGGKKHRICFREDIAKVITVDNWKMFNMDSNLAEKTKCMCSPCKIM